MTAPPSLREGRRLVRALDELETTTVVSAALPSEEGRAPRMQAMVTAVHTDYRRALAGPAGARPRAGGASFADLRDSARRLRGSPPATSRAAERGRPRGVPPPHNVEPDVVDRIARYADDLHTIVEGAGTPRRPLRRAFPVTRAGDDAPTVRPGRLRPPEARRIRLAHELGTRPLTAWTLVRLSGDMASTFSRAGEPALVRFHGALAAGSFVYWRGLMDNVAQLVSTLLGFLLVLVHTGSRPEIPTAGELLARLRRAFAVSPLWVYRETQELIGQGGKVFETAPDAGLRSLLQPDGTIVTHARTASFADSNLTVQHTAAIDAWLLRLLEGWRAANELLLLLTWVILVAAASAEFARFGWDDLWHAALRAALAACAALLARGAVAAGIRYLIFRAR